MVDTATLNQQATSAWHPSRTKFLRGPAASALPSLFGDGVKGNKFMHNGQLIIRKDGKNYNVLGGRVK